MGAIIGTMMAANVFIHIIPNQKIMLREVEAGIPHDPQLAIRAKYRSRHNNYFTLIYILDKNKKWRKVLILMDFYK